MGCICPDCREGLPEDETCPCMMTDDDDNHGDYDGVTRGPLTAEISNIRSPVRRFLNERFTAGLRDVQRRYRENARPLAVPGNDANPGTVGTAADWLLRFLVYPQPDVRLALSGASFIPQYTPGLSAALFEMCGALGLSSGTTFPPGRLH